MNSALQASRSGQFLFIAMAVAFFASGWSALLYQVVWQRLLGLFSGSDVRSVTIIVGSYLAGLGIGSLLGSAWVDRLTGRGAVLRFGLCNVGIAVFALLSRLLFYDILFLQLSSLATSPFVILVCAFLSLLIPTTLMGLSLPLLSRALVTSTRHAPLIISILYAINTLGSALGTLCATWLLIGWLGYDGTAYVGGGISLAVALLAVGTALLLPTEKPSPTVNTPVATPEPQHRRGQVGVWCLLVGTSGFIAISLEIVWFRFFGVLLGSQAYTFGHLLTFILVGYGVGSTLGAILLQRIRNPRQAFLGMQGLIVLVSMITILWVFVSYESLSERLLAAKNIIPAMRDLLLNLNGTHAFGYMLLPVVLLFLPNLLVGMTFPLVQRAVQTNSALVGRRVGLIQAANIAGNTAGSLVTGTLLLDTLGTTGTLRLLVLLALCLVLLLLWEGSRPLQRPILLLNGGLAVALGACMMIMPNNAQFWARLHNDPTGTSLVAEDSTGLSVIRRDPGTASLFANGTLQGAIPYMVGHGLIGSLPALIHPNPERIMIIGIGSAGTPFSAGIRNETKQITAVEIIGSELDVLRAYAREEGGLPVRAFLEDPRYQIVIGDGRRELMLSQQRFDIIEADAILPWRSHSGLLYSKEFFQLARSKLDDDGFMAQWRPTPRVESTFMQVFPYGIRIGDFLLIGSNQPIIYDKQTLVTRIQNAAAIEYVSRGGINAQAIVDGIINYEFVAWTPETVRQGEINTDLLPRDEYYLN